MKTRKGDDQGKVLTECAWTARGCPLQDSHVQANHSTYLNHANKDITMDTVPCSMLRHMTYGERQC